MSKLQEQPLPPAGLERRVLARLRSAGLIESATSREIDMKRVHLGWALAAAVLLAVGIFVGRMPAASPQQASVAQQPANDAKDARAQYALLLYEDASYQSSGEPNSSDRVGEYSAWARNLAADGTVMGGEKLADSGLLLSASDSGSRLPQSDVGTLTGYFVIRAQDDDQAARIAATCPHLKYGGRISLRRIET